jgi:histidine triad (HIT) family protein
MTHENCIFCRILKNELPTKKIWEDENHIAVLTPFPNTPGFTVIITKQHLDSYIFSLTDDEIINIFKAAKEVALLLDSKLGSKRTGLIVEGMGINHAHVKLIPMHGIPDGDWIQMESKIYKYSDKYEGYLSSHDGPLQSDDELNVVYNKIIN